MEYIHDIGYTVVIAFMKTYVFLKSLLLKPFAEGMVQRVFKKAGIKINGNNPWDIQVKDHRFYDKFTGESTLGLGEAYINGWWDCDKLDEYSYRVFKHCLYKDFLTPDNRLALFLIFQSINLQTKKKAVEVANKHYNLGNDLFSMFLDKNLNYSCGYFRNTDDLDQAQIDKMDLIAAKLNLKPGMKVLDIGCGWGSLCKHLSEKYLVTMVGCTISKEQAEFARKLCKGLDVDIRLQDYRDINEKFDRIVSVGMFEHVGETNYREFFTVANRCLIDDGIFLLHTIGVNHKGQPLADPWFNKYIFPNGILPYSRHITKYAEGLFILEDWHNFSYDYYKTLIAWHENFVRGWPQIADKYSKEFYRMWTYYLLVCAGGFKSRRIQLWQVVLSKNGLEGGYVSVR